MEGSMDNEKNALNNNKPTNILPFLMDHIPAAFREKAEIELQETAERRLECIKEIRERIKGEKIPNDIEFHSDFLLQFLRHGKYDVTKALFRLGNFTSMRINHNPLFNTLTDQMFEKVRSANIIRFLPWRTPDGCGIIMMKYGNWDASKIPLNDLNRYALILFQQCLRDPMTQINGLVCIHDWKNMSLGAVRQFTPKVLYEATKAYLDCLPVRYREIHAINHPTAVKFIWAIIKPLMSEKLKRRVVFHSNPKDLLDFIPPPVLPADIGGNLNEDIYESKMSDWLKKAFQQQKQYPLGGLCNYY